MKAKTNSIQNRLKRTFCIVVAIALLVSNLSIYVYLHWIYTKDYIENNKNIGVNLTERLDKDLANIENVAKLVCFDSNLQELMRNHKKYEGYVYYRTLREISSILMQYVALRDDIIDDIYIIDDEDQVISGSAYYDDTLESDWYLEFKDLKQNTYFTGLHDVNRRESNSLTDKKQVVSCIVSMYDLNRPAKEAGKMGHIIVNIKLDVLMSEIENFKDFHCRIFGQDDKAIGGTDDTIEIKNIGDCRTKSSISTGGKYYFMSDIPTAGWLLTASVDTSVVNIQMLHIMLLSLVMMLIIMLISGKAIAILAANITGPLHTLSSGIRHFSEGQYDTHVEVHSGDEVEKIAVVFNQMVDNINRQMEENHQKEKEKRKSQMRFLMAQIKPHFIYNSLNCIIYLARSKKTDDIILFTKALISLLQVSVKTGPQQKTSLSMEINYLKNYITLIKYRYDNPLEFEIHIEDGCYGIEIPGLILQPLIENSIFHGILPSNKPGKVCLSVEKEGDTVKVQIEDNGCGIAEGKIKDVREKLNISQSELDINDNIGLENVNNRLKLCFGERSGLHIESKENAGTKVWFFIY
ncbi:MAG: sensor histidine kinase [Eubacteriales bacterium]|nr:sensor histidine kinase [Eubacteriales bacterium]